MRLSLKLKYLNITKKLLSGCGVVGQLLYFCQKHTSTKSKQWLLASKFSKFEYSPEIRHFWQVRVLAKTAVFRNMRDLPDSPTFAKPCCADSPDSLRFAKLCCADLPDSPDLPTFAKPCWADSPNLPTFAKPFTEYSPDSPTFAKGHFWEKCDSPRHICTSNLPFSLIRGEWPLLNKKPKNYMTPCSFQNTLVVSLKW